MKYPKFPILVALFAALLTACETNEIDVPYPEEPAPEQTDPWVELNAPIHNYLHADGQPRENVRVLSDGDISYLSEPVVTFSEIVFKAGTPEALVPKQGEIISAAPNDELAPLGFMAYVDKVEPRGGGYVCSVHPASLDEAFENYDIDLCLDGAMMNELGATIHYLEEPDSPSRADPEDGKAGANMFKDLSKWKVGAKVIVKDKDFGVNLNFGYSKKAEGGDWHGKASGELTGGLLFHNTRFTAKSSNTDDMRFDTWADFNLSLKGEVEGSWEGSQDITDKQAVKKALQLLHIHKININVTIPVMGVPVPLNIIVEPSVSWGCFGKVALEFGLSYSNKFHIGYPIRMGAKPEMESLKTSDSPFKFESKFSLSGGMFVGMPVTLAVPFVNENVSALEVKAEPRVQATVDQEISFGDGVANTLYANSPTINFDLALGSISASAYVKSPLSWWEWEITTPKAEVALPTLPLWSTPLFPPVKISPSRKPKARTATVEWTIYNPPLYGCFLGLFTHAPKIRILQHDRKTVVTTLPDNWKYDLKTQKVYEATVTGLNPDEDYYAQAYIQCFGMTLYGDIKKLGDAADTERLTAIGDVMTMVYNTDGTIRSLRIQPDEDEASLVMYYYPDKPQAEGFMLPDKIEQYEFEADELPGGGYGPLHKTEVTRFTNIKYDNTGRITSAQTYDQFLPTDPEPVSGSVTFRYDASHGHLIEVQTYGDGGGRMNLDWVKTEKGNPGYNLSSLTTFDDGDVSKGSWGYADNCPNTSKQWPLGLSMNSFLAFFCYSGIIGEPPANLPVKVVISDGEEPQAINIFYSFANDRIFQEKWSMNAEGQTVSRAFLYQYDDVFSRSRDLLQSTSSSQGSFKMPRAGNHWFSHRKRY